MPKKLQALGFYGYGLSPRGPLIGMSLLSNYLSVGVPNFDYPILKSLTQKWILLFSI